MAILLFTQYFKNFIHIDLNLQTLFINIISCFKFMSVLSKEFITRAYVVLINYEYYITLVIINNFSVFVVIVQILPQILPLIHLNFHQMIQLVALFIIVIMMG